MSKTDPLRSTYPGTQTCAWAWMAMCPSAPTHFGGEGEEKGVVNLSKDTISSPKEWASASLLRQRMETLLSFQHLTEQSMNLPVSPCPWQSFSSARSWLKSSWWAIQLSCKYHPHEYKSSELTEVLLKQILKLCTLWSNLIIYTQSLLVGGTLRSSTGANADNSSLQSLQSAEVIRVAFLSP